MEPVATWTPRKVAAWLRGLDDSLQNYCFEDWELPGKYLLQLCPRSLEALTVWPLGHQELILEGVEQLRALSSRLQSENLQSLTEGLLEGIRAFQSLVQGRLGGCAEPPADVLSAAVELVHEARSLLFWLNRYLFSHLNDFSSCQEIGELCRELGQALQENCPAAEKESKVLRISSHVAGICHNILSCSPEELLEQKAILQCVPLDDPSGLEIHTTSNCLHFVSRVGNQVPTDSRLQILPGDEIVQINEQVVTPSQALGPPHPVSPLLASALPSPRGSSGDVFAFDLTSDSSPGPSPATWTDSTSLDPEPLPSPPAPPATIPAGVADTPEPPKHPDKVIPGAQQGEVCGSGPRPFSNLLWSFQSPVPGRKKSKGVATQLSRRRVSCRELGRPDCDGWLLLRKGPGGFMGPRWRRCWFVLKRHTLYWYRQPQDEKAEGLINVSNYSLESGQDQKRKYVFQLTHDVYKPFIFAADTLADLSMWVRHLITCISKYQSPGRAPLPREEDCYSETEAEDPDDEAGSCAASPSPARAVSSLPGDTSPAATPTQGSPRTSFGGPPTDNGEGALEGMVRGLRLGGVSLLGQLQPLTHEQWRSSFMRRNRDPQLNERAHHVRALQSTLKAKLQELQALEEVLGDPELTGEKFRRWKEQNQDLYSEGLGAWGVEQAEGSPQVLNSDSREQSSHPPPSDPEEHSHLCPLTPESDLQPPDF
ncbi:connector enhancer of kinase suppressor of ras 1 isoform X3 [Hippopotamus amphibius kiboko]|uniref:connector enhancer of kinase suppressor of ras 1 isoform X3 n=1 Tax=Hippopotamus amphibius kiboko TaxID=575201 RepID=UPI0025977683|nr:connector enhancer of kinase suppressor of ras 1 isoform X3 [Hippopotamus amphibius kiboko]